MMPGTLSTVIAAFSPSDLAAIEKLKQALDDYKSSPFSLDRRSKHNRIYGANVITIMRKYSAEYPEFLNDKYFGFYFGDESKVNPSQKSLTGLRLTENSNKKVHTIALCVFVQVLLRVFDIEDTVFITPRRKIEMRGGEFFVTELVSVNKTKIINKNCLEFITEQVKLMDERAKAKK